jgi:hypothetical protein
MAYNPFIGRDLAWLEINIQQAQDDLAAGKNIQSTSSGDVHKAERIEKSIESRLRLLLAAASIADPEKYPPDSCYAITEARVTFAPQQNISDPNQA